MTRQVYLKKIGVAVVLAGVGASVAHAASTTGHASAQVLTPLSISEDAGMNFGDIAGDKDSPTTVTLGTNGSVSAGSGAYAANNGAAGQFTVTGPSGVTYTLDLPASITLVGPGANMTVTTTHSANETLDETGKETFYVGGTLELNADQAAGTYSTTYTVTVAY